MKPTQYLGAAMMLCGSIAMLYMAHRAGALLPALKGAALGTGFMAFIYVATKLMVDGAL